ncbi:MAG: typA [candidate division NC10 bacterium]|nr:typA [candidate division NC10 bacterium]
MYFRGTFAAVVGVRRWAILAPLPSQGQLALPREMSLDQVVEYLRDDELLEVTPKSLRIRKRILDARTRGREEKRAKEALSA